MNPLKRCLTSLFGWMHTWATYVLMRLWGSFPVFRTWMASPGITGGVSHQAVSDDWKTMQEHRTYHRGDACRSMVTVQTHTHTFHVDLVGLSECSEYFRALSQSSMRETAESLIHLDHVSSSIFHSFLEFSFHHRFAVPQAEELGSYIQVSSYLLAEAFLSKCLSVLADELRPDNCLSFLSLSQKICCEELRTTVLTYLSRNLLELPHITRCLNNEEKQKLVLLRTQGDPHICSLRKENLTSWNDPGTERARRVFTLNESQDTWQPAAEFPFRADKWCFTAVVLYNYLYIIGGFRQLVRRRWEFKMASFRYNPLTHTWVSTAPLMKRRRHFSAVACDGCIYAVGGWYFDSLLTPDSNTALYTAVECYDPWKDTWRLVSSLPLTDFQFTVSLSHDVPLATSVGHCLFVLGSIQRTGEKLLLRYNTRRDSWSELLPTLTRADADLPTLYFLGATDKLLVIGGNNSDNVVTTFCVDSQKWGQVRRAQKVAFAGQGTVVGERVLMPSIEHDAVASVDLRTLHLGALPPLPISISYEAVFYLHF